MARIDKYDPISGGFRAPLAAAYTGSETPLAVGLDTNGRVVAGAGTTGIVGVVALPASKLQYDIVDVMTDGELVEFAGDAGTKYTANTTTGAITNGAESATQVPIGFCVEATRLVVRVGRNVLPAAAYA